MARNPLPNDTAQSILTMDITGVEGVRKFLDESKRNVLRMADNLTTKTAVEARKTASKAEARFFNLGEGNIKWRGNRGWVGGKSLWDSALGGYTAMKPTRNGNKYRLINFKNTKTAAFYNKGFSYDPKGRSIVRMTSQLANLWENDAVYTKPSALWITRSGGFARWGVGTRPGKHYFEGTFSTAVNKAVPTAITEAEKKFKEDQQKARQKTKGTK